MLIDNNEVTVQTEIQIQCIDTSGEAEEHLSRSPNKRREIQHFDEKTQYPTSLTMQYEKKKKRVLLTFGLR